MASFLTPLLEGTAGCVLRNARTGRTVATALELAFDSDSRRRGLLGRDSLADGAALIIAPCSSIHTFFMRFAIDVAFVTREGRIVKACHDLRPWRIAIAPGAFAVIELPSGTLARCNTVWGDTLAIGPAAQV